MKDRFRELQQHLDGLDPDMPNSFMRLAEVFEHQVFELCKIGEDESTYAIPYMMNDALEYYLVLRNCRMVGEYVRHKEADTTARIAREPDGYVLVVRQGSENTFTLYFKMVEEKIACYMYHEIGHFWVKGQEQWRQLVYIIGTIYDKYEYLGEEFCNSKELELLRLMEFAPFREWSPIHESLEDKYPATYEGIDAMEQLALEAKDAAFIKVLRLYRRFPHRYLEKKLSKMLLEAGREPLYELIYKKVKAASEMYPKRIYGHGLDEEMEAERKLVHKSLQKRGFAGTYPEYRKGTCQVIVTEEHPFTIMDMEYEDYVFRLQFMVSKCRHSEGRNSGFFKGRGRKGFIASSLEMIEGE